MSYDSEPDDSPDSGGDYEYDEGGGSPAPEDGEGGGDYSAPENDEGGGDPTPEHDEGRDYLTPEKQSSTYDRKKALLIAITYHGKHALNTLNDLEIFKEFLINRRGYTEGDITVLSEDENTPDHLKPYASNIYREMERFYEDQQNGDHYVFYCATKPAPLRTFTEPVAGHAFQTPARSDKKEEDDKDENMAVLSDGGETLPQSEDEEAPPSYYPSIIDNDIKKLLVDTLRSESTLV
ncbi:hypothetical protein DXG01_014986, partial [Tephrocybe rancida]